jgi:uncharacterized protein involved in exopolysaccharide biosynthesis
MLVMLTSVSRKSSVFQGKKWYFLLWLLANATVWSLAVVYLHKPRTYTSRWSINLPATESKTNVIVPEIGEASSSTDSPYRSFADPRENYKFLAESDEVLEAAAQQLNMSVSKFGKPRIKIVNNTTMMQFEIQGDNPKQTRAKALALHNAFNERLNQLRLAEVAQQDRNLEVALNSDREKLQVAKQRLYDYKSRSRLNSIEQLRDLSTNLEGLRRQRAETVAQLKDTSAKVQQLSASLGLSAQAASDTLTLQSDRLFQQYLTNYSQASADLLNLSATYLPANPTVIAKQTAKNAGEAALVRRGRALLGRPVSLANLQQLMLGSSGASESSSQRSALLQELISLQAQQRGIQASAQELEQQITQLESRQQILSQQESRLDSLQRDVKIAEAVFSSNITKLNLSKASLSPSYPQFTLLTPPNLPKKAVSPKPGLIFLGAGFCSLFLTTGMGTLLIRNRVGAKRNAERHRESTRETVEIPSSKSTTETLDSLNSHSPHK